MQCMLIKFLFCSVLYICSLLSSSLQRFSLLLTYYMCCCHVYTSSKKYVTTILNLCLHILLFLPKDLQLIFYYRVIQRCQTGCITVSYNYHYVCQRPMQIGCAAIVIYFIIERSLFYLPRFKCLLKMRIFVLCKNQYNCLDFSYYLNGSVKIMFQIICTCGQSTSTRNNRTLCLYYHNYVIVILKQYRQQGVSTIAEQLL